MNVAAIILMSVFVLYMNTANEEEVALYAQSETVVGITGDDSSGRMIIKDKFNNTIEVDIESDLDFDDYDVSVEVSPRQDI